MEARTSRVDFYRTGDTYYADKSDETKKLLETAKTITLIDMVTGKKRTFKIVDHYYWCGSWRIKLGIECILEVKEAHATEKEKKP
jgi:hypothetical protein